jgi:ribonuclease HIII
MEYLKFKTDRAKIEEIRDFYGTPLIEDPKRKYDLFQTLTPDGISVKAYSSSDKNLFTVLFTGKDSSVEDEARIFFKELPEPTISRPQEEKWEDLSLQIGSDEVGVGDFFSSFYVCATYLDKEGVKLIDRLGVMDSKKLTDSRIEEIGPVLLKKVAKFVVRISPDKLCELKDKKWSMHRIMANAHNLAQKSLIEKYHLKKTIPVYIDQFEEEHNYRKYVGEEIVTNPLIFRTKGETYYPSVATSSVIARYVFLEDWKQMEAELQMPIPKGADDEVDKTYQRLVKKFGQEKVDHYVKRFFANYKKNAKENG